MNWYRLRSAVVAATLLVACSEDPTASLAGDPASVTLAFSRLEVDVDASAIVDAVVRDGSGTPLSVPVAVTSTDATVATATPAQDPPHVLTRVTVQGAKIGTTKIIATAAGLADTMDVETFARTLEVTDLGPVVGTDTSGQTKSFSYAYLSATGRDLSAQLPAPTWSVDSTNRATVDPATGTIVGKDFGSVTVTAAGPGAADSLRGTATVFVEPGVFQGTVTPNPANPSGVITITPGSGPAFDPDTRVFLNRAAVSATLPNSEGDSVVSVTTSAIQVFVGDLRRPDTLEVLLSRVGPLQLSVGTDLDPDDPQDLRVAFPAPAAATPDPVDPGALLTITAGGGASFDSDTRVYLNGALLDNATPDAIVSQTASTIDVEINDLRSAGRLEALVTRIGSGAAQSAQVDSFNVDVPAAFTGTLSANGGIPAQIVTITRAAGAPAFDPPDTRVFFNGIEAFIAQGGTVDAINVAVPVIDQLGQVELRMTRLGAAQEAQKIEFTSTTKSYLDPFDAVNDNPSTAPAITANGDYFVVLSGGCVAGAGAGGADCDDFFTVQNNLTRPDTITVQIDWSGDADIDILWCNAACSAFVGNFDGATIDNPEVSKVIIPANTTWRLWLNLFDWNDSPHSLTRVRVSGKG